MLAHLIVDATVAQLSRAMQFLNGTYAENFNLKYGRTGHLFGGRFASWVIEGDEHLAHAVAYVLANPVRAGLCAEPADWRWSAAAAHIAAHRVLRTAHLPSDRLDPQSRSFQPQHLRHVLRRLHQLSPRQIRYGESLHDTFHVNNPSGFGGQFLVSLRGSIYAVA